LGKFRVYHPRKKGGKGKKGGGGKRACVFGLHRQLHLSRGEEEKGRKGEPRRTPGLHHDRAQGKCECPLKKKEKRRKTGRAY